MKFVNVLIAACLVVNSSLVFGKVAIELPPNLLSPDIKSPYQVAPDELGLIRSINSTREKYKLKPMLVDPILMEMARKRISHVDMHHRGDQDGWNHRALGLWPAENATRMGFHGFATENLAMGESSPEEAVKDWMSLPSVGHREQILDMSKLNGKFVKRGYNRIGAASLGRNYIVVFGVKDGS